MQERNPYSLNSDSEEEIPGDRLNRKTAKSLDKLELSCGADYVSENFKKWYQSPI